MSKKITIIIEDEEPVYITSPYRNLWDDSCAFCPNNPKNGGSGICLCTIPLMQKSFTQTITSNTVVVI